MTKRITTLAIALTLGASLAACSKSEPAAEGEATAHVLSELLMTRGVQVTRLSRGVPVGSELEYVDLGTIAYALSDRR